MSVKLDIYNAIDSEITSRVSAIKDIHVWNNQVENEDMEPPDAHPMIYVEFKSIDWHTTELRTTRFDNRGKNQQRGSIIITLHIVFWSLKNETLAFADIDPTIEQVLFAIMGLRGNFFGPLLRIGERQHVGHPAIIDWQMDFKTEAMQAGVADEDLVQIPADTLTLNDQVSVDVDDETIRVADDR